MRPSTGMSADGPFNLYNAVVTAADKASASRGVLVVMNDTVLDGRDVTKTNTTDVATFKSVNYGPLGYITAISTTSVRLRVSTPPPRRSTFLS